MPQAMLMHEFKGGKSCGTSKSRDRMNERGCNWSRVFLLEDGKNPGVVVECFHRGDSESLIREFLENVSSEASSRS